MPLGTVGGHKQQAQSCVHMWVTCTHSIRHIHTCAHSLLPLMKPISIHGHVHTPPWCTWVRTHTHTHVHTYTQSHTACEYAHLWTPTHINTQRHTRARPLRHTAHEDKYMHTCIPHVHTGHTRAHSEMVWGSPQDHPGFSDLLGSQHVAVLLAMIYQ